jgi:hypothetical protein
MPTLTTSEFPLVLFGATAHPDKQYRKSLLQRLDEAIDALPAHYPTPLRERHELRAFFVKMDRRRKGGILLSPPLRELAIRLALLTFTREQDNRLLIAEGESCREKAGYIIDDTLQAIDLRRSSKTRHRMKRQAVESRFLVGEFLTRLGHIRRGACPVQAACRVTDRIRIEIRGAIPWDTKAAQRTPPGWSWTAEPHHLCMWPESPEAVLRLTAGMAAGKTLCFQGPRGGAILVRLQDFEGDAVALKAQVTPAQAEPWLSRIPPPPLTLTAEDRLALARWAYPLTEWLTPELTENLL